MTIYTTEGQFILFYCIENEFIKKAVKGVSCKIGFQSD